METEVPVAKLSLYVINRAIPYFVKGFMLRNIAQMAVFATRGSEPTGSGDSGKTGMMKDGGFGQVP